MVPPARVRLLPVSQKVLTITGNYQMPQVVKCVWIFRYFTFENSANEKLSLIQLCLVQWFSTWGGRYPQGGHFKFSGGS